MRILAVLLVTVSLHGQTVFPIGTPKELGPMPANAFDVARVGEEGLAAWSVQGSGTYLARYDLAGNRIGEIMQIVGCDGPEVASDGRDALVVCSDDATVRAIRVTAAGMSEGRVVTVDGYLRELAWNGREYVVLTRTNSYAYALTRLDGDGWPVSGSVHFPSGFFTVLTLACGDTRCMIATFAFGTKSRIRAAVVNESDFPAIGSSRPVRTFGLFDGTFIQLGFTDCGFYSLTGQPDGLALRRHGRLRGLPNRALRLGLSQPLVVQPSPAWPVVASNGSDIHVAAGPLHRITPAGVKTVVPAGYPYYPYLPLGIVAADSGTLLFWRDSSRLVHLTRVTENSFPGDGALVSVGLPLEFMPRLARGHSTLMAAWLEGSRPSSGGVMDDASLYYSMLDLEGRPLTAPVLLDDYVGNDATIAFDGVNFLIIWRSNTTGTRYGHLISQDGKLVGERIVFQCYRPILTLVWSRNAYLISCNGLQRIAPSGTFLDVRPQFTTHDALLVRDEEQDLLRGLGVDLEYSDFSGGPGVLATFHFVSIDDRTLPFREMEQGAFTPQVAVDYNALPGVAVGGGSEIAVFQDGRWGRGPLLYLVGSSTPLPYPPPTPEFHKSRLHAHWSGREFIIVAGRTLARHAPDGTLLGTLSLGEDVGDAAVVGDGPDAVVVLRQRGDGHSIEAMRVNIPAN